MKIYNICILSENIDLFVQALEMDRKVDIWQAFLICLTVSANKFYFCRQHIIFILQCQNSQSHCQMLLDRSETSIIPVIIPPLPEGGGGILFYLCPSFRPSKIFFVAFFSVTVDGRNLIFGHKHHIGIPYCG